MLASIPLARRSGAAVLHGAGSPHQPSRWARWPRGPWAGRSAARWAALVAGGEGGKMSVAALVLLSAAARRRRRAACAAACPPPAARSTRTGWARYRGWVYGAAFGAAARVRRGHHRAPAPPSMRRSSELCCAAPRPPERGGGGVGLGADPGAVAPCPLRCWPPIPPVSSVCSIGSRTRRGARPGRAALAAEAAAIALVMVALVPVRTAAQLGLSVEVPRPAGRRASCARPRARPISTWPGFALTADLGPVSGPGSPRRWAPTACSRRWWSTVVDSPRPARRRAVRLSAALAAAAAPGRVRS